MINLYPVLYCDSMVNIVGFLELIDPDVPGNKLAFYLRVFDFPSPILFVEIIQAKSNVAFPGEAFMKIPTE